MMTAYREDLAYIHDTGFGFFAEAAAPVVIGLLREGGARRGRVVELGCGSGILAEKLVAAGYDVVGFDQSAAMVRLARARVPSGEFRVESFVTAELPPCAAVTSIGEVFNYLFDANNTAARLTKLFRRVYDALEPGGWLVFDIATPGRGGRTGSYRTYREGDEWACLVECEEDTRRGILTRAITSFRKNGELYARDHETHRLRLYDPAEILRQLRKIGFRVRVGTRYGEYRFLPGIRAFFARKV
jgi:SAM-dependent methyltransferase